MTALPLLTRAQRSALLHVMNGTGMIRHVYNQRGNVYSGAAGPRALHALEAMGLIADVRGASTGSGIDSYEVTITAKGRQALEANA